MEKSEISLSTALTIFEDHLPDIRKACVENAKTIRQSPHKYLEDDDEVSVESIQLHVNHLIVEEKVAPLLRTMNRIDGRKRHYSGGITEVMIEAAKNHPITELVDTPIKGGMTRCPFHDDKTASLSLRRYNRYRCFGCDERGSVIDFYMKISYRVEGDAFISFES
jgi:hypothetical protein